MNETGSITPAAGSDGPATLRQVAARAGLSLATASRAISGHPAVKPATAARVRRAAGELGYVPSYAARQLARRRSDTLAVVFPVVASGFFAEVLDGIDQEAAAHGFQLETLFTRHRHNEEELLARCAGNRRSGALLVMNVMLDGALVRRAVELALPMVLLDRPMPGHDVPAVMIDNVGGAKAAMTHLLDRGCRRIAVLAGPADTYDAAERLRGCRRAVRTFGRGGAVLGRGGGRAGRGGESARCADPALYADWPSRIMAESAPYADGPSAELLVLRP